MFVHYVQQFRKSNMRQKVLLKRKVRGARHSDVIIWDVGTEKAWSFVRDHQLDFILYWTVCFCCKPDTAPLSQYFLIAARAISSHVQYPWDFQLYYTSVNRPWLVERLKQTGVGDKRGWGNRGGRAAGRGTNKRTNKQTNKRMNRMRMCR